MKIIATIGILFLILIFSILIISCSRKVAQFPRVSPSTYLSPQYEDEAFNNVSMDICYYNTSDEQYVFMDSVTMSMMQNFDSTFRKYFADGIKMFSCVTKTDWIYYDLKKISSSQFIQYNARTRDGKDFEVFLTDSLSMFQRQSNADFLFLLHSNSVSVNNSNDMNGYKSVIFLDYSIWNNKNSDLIIKDRVTSQLKFSRLTGKWPFRSSVLKAASEIFEKLPMFSK